MGRKACCPKEGMNRGSWTAMEDSILVSYIQKHGEGKWGSLPRRAGLKRCGKSCRLRWLNYLRPGIKRGNISSDEEELIVRLHRLLGNRWSLIAGRLPGRTDNEIKNYWNTTLCKKVLKKSSGGSKGDNDEAGSGASTRLPLSQAIRAVSDAAPEASARRRSPEPEASPVRTKALRCTTRLPAVQAAAAARYGCAALETAAAGDGHVHAAEQAAGQKAPAVEVYPPPEDDLSIDLDFDMGELGFLSPWRGEVADGGGGEVDVDLEALMLGPGGDSDLHDFTWF